MEAAGLEPLIVYMQRRRKYIQEYAKGNRQFQLLKSIERRQENAAKRYYCEDPMLTKLEAIL